MDIQKFLNKKTWTGEEVGKVLIYNLMHTYDQSLAGNVNPKTLFLPEQMTKMLSSITDRTDILHYNRFLGLQHWISQTQAVANAYYQRLQGEINAIVGIVTTAKAVEIESEYIQRLPALMTQKQYDDFKASGESAAFFKTKNERAIRNGIAIIQTDGPANSQIDENGYYREPVATNTVSILLGIERYTPKNENFLENIESLRKSKDSIEECFYWIKGYDTAIDLIAEYINIPEFIVFKVNYRPCEEQIEMLNSLIAFLGCTIQKNDCSDQEKKQAKLQALNQFFHPFHIQELVIPDEAIAQAKEMLQDNMRAFETQNGLFTQVLTTRRANP